MLRPVVASLLAVLCASMARPVAAQAIAGRIFEDANADGIADSGEAGLSALPVDVFGNGIDVPGATDANGDFVIPVSAGCRGVFVDFPAEPDPITSVLGTTGGAMRRIEADWRTCPPPSSNPVGLLRYGVARHLRDRLQDPNFLFIQLGDSIAAGVSFCILADSDYSPEVATELDCLGPSSVTRDNRAVAGWHSEDLLTPMDGSSPNDQYIPNVVAAAPDLVTISIGGNDFLNTEPNAAGQNYPFNPADLQSSIQELINTRRSVQEILSNLVSGLPDSDIEINSVYDNQADSCSTTDFHAAAPPIWNEMLRSVAWGQLRPVQVGEAAPDFAHQNVTRTSCCGAEGMICGLDGIHPTHAGSEIIHEAIAECLGRVTVPAAGATGFDVGALRLVAVLPATQWNVVQGAAGVIRPEAAIAVDGSFSRVDPGSITEVSGFQLPAGITPVRVIVGVRYRTTAAFNDDTHLFDASFVDFAPPQFTFDGWDTDTPIVGGSGTGGDIAASSRVNAMPNVPNWRDVTAMMTLNAIDDGRTTGEYSWPAPTAADIANVKVRLTVNQVGTPDGASVDWDGAWLWVYGLSSGSEPPPGEVSGPGDAPLLVHRDRGIVIDWAPEALAQTYRAWRGDIGDWSGARAEPGVAGGCVNDPTTTWTESEPPDQRPNWYFLVSAVNSAGSGPLGFDSFGTAETSAPAGCP